MAVGIFAVIKGFPASDGQVILLGGLLFGLGLHWYRKWFGFKALVTGVLIAMLALVSAGAVKMGEPLLWLLAFLLAGGSYHMLKDPGKSKA